MANEDSQQRRLQESEDCIKSLNAQRDQQQREEDRRQAQQDAQRNANQQQARKEEK
jgi:hypothetical protein